METDFTASSPRPASFVFQSMSLKVKRIHADAVLPSYATSGSACFDIPAYAGVSAEEIVAYDPNGNKRTLMAFIDIDDADAPNPQRLYLIPSKWRALVPTGLKFSLPVDPTGKWVSSVRAYARSGLSTKGGVTLVNGTGIIDSDYAEQIFIPIYNISDLTIKVNHGARIAQGEMVWRERFEIVETKDDVVQTTERNGGFGSTGT